MVLLKLLELILLVCHCRMLAGNGVEFPLWKKTSKGQVQWQGCRESCLRAEG